MDENIFQQRYKDYCNALIGKQYGDQFLNIFEQRHENSKYSNVFLNSEKYWIMNITKLTELENTYYSVSNHRLTLHNMYLHKHRDFAVLKANIIQSHSPAQNHNFNIKRYIGYRLKKLGFNHYEFNNKLTYQSINTMTSIIKILIPPDKQGEHIVELITMIDKINNFICAHSFSVWNDTATINEFVKIE